MIKFFRIIRQNLLSENRFRRYLYYAIGEILLVMIGILLALQVNNWNEYRKSNNELINSLNKLGKDLYADSLFIESVKLQYEENYQYALNLWNQLYEGKPISNSGKFIIETQDIGRAIYFELNDNQYSSMVTNNILKSIKNEALKFRIARYYNNRHGDEIFSLLWERNLKFHDLVVDAIPLEAHIPIIQRDSLSFTNWVQNSPNANHDVYEKLKSNEKLNFSLKNVIRTYLLSIRGLNRKAELNSELRNEIKTYISKNSY